MRLTEEWKIDATWTKESLPSVETSATVNCPNAAATRCVSVTHADSTSVLKTDSSVANESRRERNHGANGSTSRDDNKPTAATANVNDANDSSEKASAVNASNERTSDDKKHGASGSTRTDVNVSNETSELTTSVGKSVANDKIHVSGWPSNVNKRTDAIQTSDGLTRLAGKQLRTNDEAATPVSSVVDAWTHVSRMPVASGTISMPEVSN